MATMTGINGFRIIHIHLNPNSTVRPQMFIKPHTVRKENPDKPSKQTLFVINVPPYINADDLKVAFGRVGEVTKVICQEKVDSDDNQVEEYDNFNPEPSLNKFKFAYVVFQSPKSVTRAMELKEMRFYDEKTKKPVVKAGLDQWMQDYLKSNIKEDDLNTEIEKYMAEYDRKEKEAERAEKAGTVNDGWMTVTKRGPVPAFQQKGSILNRVQEIVELQRRKMELTNFYTFQIRESRMQHIVDLRRKYEEDRIKIERLKLARRFHPFHY